MVVDQLEVLLQRQWLRVQGREGLLATTRRALGGGVEVGVEAAHELVGEQPDAFERGRLYSVATRALGDEHLVGG